MQHPLSSQLQSAANDCFRCASLRLAPVANPFPDSWQKIPDELKIAQGPPAGNFNCLHAGAAAHRFQRGAETGTCLRSPGKRAPAFKPQQTPAATKPVTMSIAVV